MEEQSCPAGACQELQDVWAKGEGAFDPNSKYCKSCMVDEPTTAEICKAKTLEAKAKKAEKKAAQSTRASKVPTVGFGHVVGTQAAAIDSYLISGMSIEAMVKQLNKDGKNFYSIADSKLKSRIKNHFNHLKTLHGIGIIKEGDKYFGRKEE